MIFLDCGNSQIKAQYFQADRLQANRLQASFACSYRVDWNHHLSRWLESIECAHAHLCSVLDRERQAELDACLARQFGAAVTRFSSRPQALGVTSGYEQPDRLGVDRWMALLGAAGMTASDCIVIDAGSAITIDLLRGDGRHLGGAILPGLNTSIEAFKCIFSHIDFSHPAIADSTMPGCSTEAAIQIDYAHHTTESLPALVNRWIPLLQDDVTLLLAGGDAGRVQRLLEQRLFDQKLIDQALFDQKMRIVPDLVFRGMHRLVD
jgi:type III pantothenate kinase